jgi:UDP-glucose:(heptosyl)LPS alpha-1,3-glucosyltransferase
MMILNFCLFKYFPYGGMQRDCLRLARACSKAGYQVNILTINWKGPKPEGDLKGLRRLRAN